jgi:hypothetical protein
MPPITTAPISEAVVTIMVEQLAPELVRATPRSARA